MKPVPLSWELGTVPGLGKPLPGASPAPKQRFPHRQRCHHLHHHKVLALDATGTNIVRSMGNIRVVQGKEECPARPLLTAQTHAGVEVAGERQAKPAKSPLYSLRALQWHPYTFLSQLQWQMLGRPSDRPWRMGNRVWSSGTISLMLLQQEP